MRLQTECHNEMGWQEGSGNCHSLQQGTATFFMPVIPWFSSMCYLKNKVSSVKCDFCSWWYLNWSYETRLNLKIGPRFIITGKQHDTQSSFPQKAGQGFEQISFSGAWCCNRFQVSKLLWLVLTSKGLFIYMMINQVKQSWVFYKRWH